MQRLAQYRKIHFPNNLFSPFVFWFITRYFNTVKKPLLTQLNVFVLNVYLLSDKYSICLRAGTQQQQCFFLILRGQYFWQQLPCYSKSYRPRSVCQFRVAAKQEAGGFSHPLPARREPNKKICVQQNHCKHIPLWHAKD